MALLMIALLAFVVGGVRLTASGMPARLALWTLAVALYGMFWFAVATAVAALGKPSATNAMVLAGIWLVLVILVPSLVSMTSPYFVAARTLSQRAHTWQR